MSRPTYEQQVAFEQWRGDVDDAGLELLKEKAQKRMWIFLLISLVIPVVGMFLGGCVIFCYNNVQYIKSRGASDGSPLVRFILLLFFLFIPPIIVFQICKNSEKIGYKVLGWE